MDRERQECFPGGCAMNGNLVLLAGITLISGLALTAVIRPVLVRMGTIDVPNHRSSHTLPVVRGAGLAPALALGLALAIHSFSGPQDAGSLILVVCLLAALALAVVGLVEDVRGVPALYRLMLQLGIGALTSWILVMLTDSGYWFIPVGALIVASCTNVANFMDGINGISGLHGLAVGCLYAVVGVLTGVGWLTTGGILLAAVFTAFLPWNILKPRMFLGDVGSYLLGAATASLALGALLSGVSPVAVFGVAAIYIADTGLTLLARLRAGAQLTQAHRDHVYQRLTDAGFTHLQVAAGVTILSLVTGAAGLLALDSAPVPTAMAIMIILAICALYMSAPVLVKHTPPQARVSRQQQQEPAP